MQPEEVQLVAFRITRAKETPRVPHDPSPTTGRDGRVLVSIVYDRTGHMTAATTLVMAVSIAGSAPSSKDALDQLQHLTNGCRPCEQRRRASNHPHAIDTDESGRAAVMLE